jgi:hypothetical protein
MFFDVITFVDAALALKFHDLFDHNDRFHKSGERYRRT